MCSFTSCQCLQQTRAYLQGAYLWFLLREKILIFCTYVEWTYGLSRDDAMCLRMCDILLGCVALIRGVVGYSHQTFPWTICRSVRRSVCPVHCGNMADRIRMPFGTIGQTSPGMRHIVGFGDWSTGRGTFGGEIGVHHCNQWGLYSVGVR